MHRKSLMITLLLFLLTLSIGQAQTKSADKKTQDTAKSKSSAADKSKGDSRLPSPLGRPVQDKVKVKTMRYFVWYDSTGWHLRTASRAVRKFTGTIKLTAGTFGKLRPVGLESKGRFADRWVVNKDRNEIKFEIFTAGSFDGFDFSAKSPGDAKVEFDLTFTDGKKSEPKKIFIGREEKHPQTGKFSFDAKP